MAETQGAFVRATDELIALYRNAERRTLDLPFLSLMPFAVSFWEVIKFDFFFLVGIFLIIPVNIVILIRNIFPGHWNYRPFFLRQLKYVCLWVWRGEVPFAPSLFIRPLFISFIKAHFERRLLRLRREIALRDDISEPTRNALTTRLDAALENWKYRRIATLLFTILLPAIAYLPTWGKQFTDLLEFLGIHIPIATAETFVSTFVSQMSSGARMLWVTGILTYLLSVPTTAFLAKRGLFIGREPNRIWFPGGQDGGGLYFAEKKILANVGLHAREVPIDFWILGLSMFVAFASTWAFGQVEQRFFLNLMTPAKVANHVRSQFETNIAHQQFYTMIVWSSVFSIMFVIAAFRRRDTGRL